MTVVLTSPAIWAKPGCIPKTYRLGSSITSMWIWINPTTCMADCKTMVPTLARPMCGAVPASGTHTGRKYSLAMVLMWRPTRITAGTDTRCHRVVIWGALISKPVTPSSFAPRTPTRTSNCVTIGMRAWRRIHTTMPPSTMEASSFTNQRTRAIPGRLFRPT